MKYPCLSRFLFHVSRCVPVIAFLLIVTLSIPQSVSAQLVEIPDPNLEKAIRERLELSDEVPITQTEMLRLKRLIAKNAQIADLTGLEYATNLNHLVLSANEIQDITPLAGLINLDSLNLHKNPITDLFPLSHLTQLTYLNLTGVPIKDLTPLANLTQLKELHLGRCQIRDLTPLSNLTQLMVLNLNNNQIVDVSPLANLTQLTDLTIASNPITDFRPLLELNLQNVDIDIHKSHELASSEIETPDLNLERAIREQMGLPSEVPLTQLVMSQLTVLTARRKQIADLTGLEYATNLKKLVLSVNEIRDITPIGMLTNLNSLTLRENPITDLTPLGNLTNLTYIDLAEIKVSDISSLANLTELRQAVLGRMLLRDITPLGKLVNLTYLNIRFNQIEDISPLANLTQLEELYISDNQILDCSPLEGLSLTVLERDDFCVDVVSREIVEIPDPNLRQAVGATLGLPDEDLLTEGEMSRLVRLKAKEAGIEDLTGLEHALNLKTLDLAANEIRDITLLRTLTKLNFLILGGNPITDLTPLGNLTNLTYINLAGIKVSDISPLANLTQLRQAVLSHMRLRDITTLGKLVNLIQLNIKHNQIEDITPLANLTQLQELHIFYNRILDFTPLDGLSLVTLTRDEVCLTPNSPIKPRLENRNFPSTLKAFGDPVLNRPELSKEERIALHDLWLRGVHFQKTSQGYQLTGNIEGLTAERDALLALNPNMIFLAAIRQQDAQAPTQYPEDWFGWLRDDEGNPIRNPKHPNVYLMDITLPEVQDIIVEQAISVDKCGLFDGIFFDQWREDGGSLRDFSVDPAPLLRPPETDREARLAILQRIRANVPDDFLILCNRKRAKFKRSAPYINGAFMETFQDYPGGYTYDGLIEIESTLLWSENNLQEPQINFLEGWGIASESPDSPANKRWMRVFTTMSLTHSDGYVLYNIGALRTGGLEHAHHWYNFWDADLGQPIGEKGQLYAEIPGLFIREFDNGWAVYNRSGKPQTITLTASATPVSDRGSNAASTTHLLPDLDGEIYLKAPNPADVNGDRVVDILDLILVANSFGTSVGDVNKDGTTNMLDLTLVAQQFSQ